MWQSCDNVLGYIFAEMEIILNCFILTYNIIDNYLSLGLMQWWQSASMLGWRTLSLERFLWSFESLFHPLFPFFSLILYSIEFNHHMDIKSAASTQSQTQINNFHSLFVLLPFSFFFCNYFLSISSYSVFPMSMELTFFYMSTVYSFSVDISVLFLRNIR